jgi:tetratricopeptide (TPR) repeat protein
MLADNEESTPRAQSQATREANPKSDAWRTHSLRWTFGVPMAVLCAAALLLRLAILDEFLRENPLAECPQVDAEVYWQTAARMAGGQWADSTPFLAAPLYPYLLGAIRTLGGDLLAVYVVQLLMHLATGVLIAWTTRIRFGVPAGVLAATLFFALTEPAISCTRVLANTLQLLLVVLVWWRWVALSQRGCRWRDVLAGGALVGLLALAYPPAVLLLPIYALSVWYAGHWRWPAIAKASVGVLAALLAISPATLHNLLLHGEFIPITAHSGITLRQGNGPDARGRISVVPGVSLYRAKMHDDAARQFESIYGRKGTWREIDRHFRQEAINYWLRNPLSALELFGRKFYFYLTARNYDDIMSTAIERESGLANRAILAPLATPWLMGTALVGLIAALRRPVRYAPEWTLALLPLAVVLVFFYTARYRLPAVPLMCALSAYAITHCRRFRVPAPIVIASFFLPLPLYAINLAKGIDSPDEIRVHFQRVLSVAQEQVGNRRAAAEEFAQAEQRYRSALELWDGNFRAHKQLGCLYAVTQRPDDAVRELNEAIRLKPMHQPSHLHLYNTLCIQQRYAEAAAALRYVTQLTPDDAKVRLTLAWLLATCPDDRVRNGDEALRHAQAAQDLTTPDRWDVLDVLAAAHAELGQFDRAVEIGAAAAAQARQTERRQLSGEIEQRVADYRSRKPCRAPPRLIRTD